MLINKKLIIPGLVLILLLSFASAEVFDEDTGGSNWNGNNPTSLDLLSVGGWSHQGGDTCLAYLEDAGNDYDGDDFYINPDCGEETNYINATLNGNATLFTVWFYDDATDTGYTTIQSAPSGGGGAWLGIEFGNSNYVVYYTGIQATDVARSTGWHNFTFYWYEGNSSVISYIDNVKVAEKAQDPDANIGITSVRLAVTIASGTCENCKWDNFHFWNATTAEAPDTTAPTWTNNVTNTSLPKPNDVVNFSIDWADDIELSQCGFMLANDTTHYVNYTINDCTTPATISWLSELNASYLQTVKYMFWANDTSNKINFTDEFTLTMDKLTGSINVSSPYPLNNTQYDYTTINFNVTLNASIKWNVSLWVNDSLINFTGGTTTGKNIYVEFNYTMDESHYRYFFQVNDSYMETNTSVKTFFVDESDPTLLTNFTNLYLFKYGENITGEFNFSDNLLLYSINFSIDSQQIDYFQQINLSTYQYNLNYNASLFGVGKHTLNVTFADGHTSKTIPKYDWSNGLFNDYIKYTFPEETWVKIKQKDSSLFDSWTTNKLKDRYTFTFNPSKENEKSYTFTVTSDEKIEIINTNSKYKNYLIIGDHWLDFVLGIQEQTVDIVRVDDNEVEVTIGGLSNLDQLNFNSIGDLNIVTQNYDFIITNFTVEYSSSVNELQSNLIGLYLNVTDNTTSTNAKLIWNGSEKSVTKVEYSNYHYYYSSFVVPSLDIDTPSTTVNFNWFYGVNNTYNNITGNTTDSQTVNFAVIDNCSTYTMRGINISLLYESNDSVVEAGTIDGWFKLWDNSSSTYKQYNLSWHHLTGNSPVGVCFAPNSSSYTFYSQLEYQDDDKTYSKKYYYYTNNTLNNQTQFLNLYLTNGTTQVKFNVFDFNDDAINDDAISDATIKILSYDVGTNSYVTTEILNTDSDGAAYGSIILNTEFYQFIVEVDGVQKLLTLPTIISTTEKTFRIDLDADYFNRYTNVNNLVGSVSFTNSTQNFAFTFSDLTGAINQGCLRINRKSSRSDTTINQTCVTSTASTIIINIGVGTETNTTDTFTGVGYVVYSDGQEFVIDTLSVTFNYFYKKFGKSGLFMGFLLVLALFLIGIWNPVVSVILGMVGVFALIIMGIISLTWGGIVVLVIMSGLVIYRLSRN